MLIFKYYKYRNINKYCKYRRKYKLQIYLGLLISSNLICVIRLSNLYSISPVNTHYCYIIFFRILMVILEQESKFDPNKKQEQKKYLLPEKKYKTTKLQLIYLLLSKGKEQRSLSWCGFWTGKELQHIKTHSPMIYIYVCVCVYIYIYIFFFFASLHVSLGFRFLLVVHGIGILQLRNITTTLNKFWRPCGALLGNALEITEDAIMYKCMAFKKHSEYMDSECEEVLELF